MPVTPTPTEPSAAPSLELLALARRGAAHEVNNLLAVIQGNAQLLPLLPADQARDVLGEIDLACERLVLVCDGWLLADPGPPPGGQRCGVADVLRQVVSVVRMSEMANIDIVCDASADLGDCGIGARTLRALAYCALATLLRSAAHPVVAVRLVARGGACTVELQAACTADRTPTVFAPDTLVTGAALHTRSVSSGLWEVGQCLQRHGGGMRHAFADGVFHLHLDLPAPTT